MSKYFLKPTRKYLRDVRLNQAETTKTKQKDLTRTTTFHATTYNTCQPLS